MATFLWCALAVVVALLLLTAWGSTLPDRPKPPGEAEAEPLEAYFRQARDWSKLDIDDIVAAVGPWQGDVDDWDFGRRIFEWRRPGLRIRVCAQGTAVRVVEFMDVNDETRFGTVTETLWQQRFDFQWSQQPDEDERN